MLGKVLGITTVDFGENVKMEDKENKSRYVTFVMGGMTFEYDEDKNQKNIKKHGISFKTAARVFFDYDRIEMYDEENSIDEDRYDTIGDTSAGNKDVTIGGITQFTETDISDVLFVVYTERMKIGKNGSLTDVTRIISARLATNFERGIYYGKY
jgi:hypothetical protein